MEIIELTPILAEIEHQNSLGKSKWFEVVYYFDGHWRCYAGSNTFEDGEKVIRWVYCNDCFANEKKYSKFNLKTLIFKLKSLWNKHPNNHQSAHGEGRERS